MEQTESSVDERTGLILAIFVALGANQNSIFEDESNPPVETFKLVCGQLEMVDIRVLKVSGIWESPAWPDPKAQPAYNNAVIQVETELKPVDLLSTLKDLEYAFGRQEGVRNAPRPLDLDILDYDGEILDGPNLKLPHPRMCDRPFVLFPLSEISPNWTDPIKNRAVQDWIARLEYSEVKSLKWLGNIL